MLADLFIRGLIIHFVADWILQSDWMSENKSNLRHPAAWVHSGIHTIGFTFVFPLNLAILLGLGHLIIDTRIPLNYMRKIMGQRPEGPQGISFMMWQDQVVHILLVFVASTIA